VPIPTLARVVRAALAGIADCTAPAMDGADTTVASVGDTASLAAIVPGMGSVVARAARVSIARAADSAAAAATRALAVASAAAVAGAARALAVDSAAVAAARVVGDMAADIAESLAATDGSGKWIGG